MQFTVATLLAVVPAVLGHGLIKTPAARDVGKAQTERCGAGVVKFITDDPTNHVEGMPEIAAKATDYHADKCNLWLCKGMQFDDNTANVHEWQPNQVIDLKLWIRIPHEGNANVSIVDTKSNKVIGEFLKAWDKGYAPGSKEADVPLSQREFSVTIPDGLEEKCATAGDCVLQWWWYGFGAKQTYESCVDFVIKKKGMSDGKPGRRFVA